ncbi:MAG: fatty acid desaturase, partial [Methylocystis sp.]|nr:fatty acid desaturase [Methylocystis sp.]
NWSYQSAQVAFRENKPLAGWLCIAHWVIGYLLAGMLTPGPFWTGWLWFTVAQMIGGLFLGTVFIVNHTGMEVYDAAEARGFYDRQARSTRNTTSTPFHDWAAGGLNSQIEHHMFPTMRRSNLAKMRPATKQAMIECGYHYEECDNRTAIRAVMDALKQAAKA